MLYYKVKKEYEAFPMKKHGKRNQVTYLIPDELWTVAELSDYDISTRFMENAFEQIEISKADIYWSFGTRFQKRRAEDEN